jgi:signal transduction histidine kinase
MARFSLREQAVGHIARSLIAFVFRTLVVSLAIWSNANGAAQAQERLPHVLLLYPYDNTHAASTIAGEAARKQLIARLDGKVNFNIDFLDLIRFPDEKHQQRTAQYLAEKYAQAKIDLILTLNTQTQAFARKYRDQFAPKAPVIFCCVGSWMADAAVGRESGITGTYSDYDITKTLELAARLQPQARNLVLVGGASKLDQTFLNMYRKQAAAHAQRYTITVLNGLDYNALLERVSRLQTDSVVILGTLFVDGTGQEFVSYEAAEAVAKASGAPAFAPIDTYLGRGIVGGHIGTFEDAGREVADMAAAVLKGADPGTIPPRSSQAQKFRVDAKQLQRWGLSEKSLPPDTIVYFKQPTLWEQHRETVIAASAIILIQAASIATLIVQILRRRRAEQAMQSTQSELARVARATTMGEMTASIAHEVNQPLAAIVASGGAGLRLLNGPTADLDKAKAAFKRIVEEGHRASDVISTIRAMFKKDSQSREPVDLNQVVLDVLALLLSQAQTNDVAIRTGLDESLPMIRGDRVQLQQVILNLAVNAIEATAGIAGRERIVRIDTGIGGGGEIVLSVEDTGSGIAPAAMDRVFEAFYTTKANGMGMGLSICRSIVEAHDGRLSVARGSPVGTIFRAILPTSATD